MTQDGADADWTRHVVLITGADGKGHGSGFVVRRAGAVSHVVTCAHVVTDLGPTLIANGRPAKVLYDGTGDGIDLAVLAAEGLTEEALSLTRVAAVGDDVLAVGFTRVDRGRRATARPAKIREATQLTYDPQQVVKKHPGWLLAMDGDQITDGFSGGPVVAADTGLVVGVLGLRGAGTADAIAISNLSAWRDAPPAVSPIREEIDKLRRSGLRARVLEVMLVLSFVATGVLTFLLVRDRPRSSEPAGVTDGGVAVVRDGGTGSGSVGGGGGRAAVIDEITVRAAMGWQVSRNTFEAGTTLCVEPGGRVNVAMNEVYNLAQVGKQLMAKYADAGTRLASFRAQLGSPNLTEANRFRTGWTGPEGSLAVKDAMLDECLLRREAGWGALLVVQLPELGYVDYDARDPIRLLNEEANLDRTEIQSHGGRRPITMKRAGRLAFIVNDLVLSDLSPSPICQQAFAALHKAARELARDDAHRIDEDTIPLFWYLDNLGEFRVKVTRETNCSKIIPNARTTGGGREADSTGLSDSLPVPGLAPVTGVDAGAGAVAPSGGGTGSGSARPGLPGTPLGANPPTTTAPQPRPSRRDAGLGLGR